jgi:glycine dehydrogenase subunit 1
MYSFLPHTDEIRKEMLDSIGLGSIEELFNYIDNGARLREDLNLPDGISELEAKQKLGALAAKNKNTSQNAYFIGGGCYNRFVPSCISNIVQRSEFITAYTPYQPEVSQGTLQAIYEYQTMICNLTGMDVSNAGVYDGATACAEAVLMSVRIKKNKSILVPSTLNPDYKKVIETYCGAIGVEIDYMPQKNGLIDIERLKELDRSYSCIIVQSPNYLGNVEDVLELADVAKSIGAMYIVCADPVLLSILEAPGYYGADIVVGELQSLGIPMSFGGPGGGFMACKTEYLRQIPGRIVGMTVDKKGDRAFSLTMQTREQHIRREKSTSNICSNQALMALWATIYMTALGQAGLKEISEISFHRAHYLAKKINELNGFEVLYQNFMNEFIVKIDSSLSVDEVLSELESKHIFGGIKLDDKFANYKNCILVCVTEMNSIDDIYRYISVLKEISLKEVKIDV